MSEPTPHSGPSVLDGPRHFSVRSFSLSEELRGFAEVVRNYFDAGIAHHRRFGDVFRARLPHRSLIFAHPRHLYRVLRSNVLNYGKGSDYEFLRPLLGNGLFLSEGDLWTQQRRLVAPEFRPNTILRFLPTMIDKVEEIFAEWDRSGAQGVRDLSDDMMRFTLWVVGGALFRSDFHSEAEEIGRALEICLEQGTLQMLSFGLLQPWMPTPGNRKAREAEARLNSIVRSIIARSRGGNGTEVDVLSRLLVAVDEQSGARMSEQQLVDEVKSLILAGHETTSLALSWAFYLLSEHPEVEARLVAESRTVLGDRRPTAEDIPRLVYTRQVLQEVLRLYPPVPAVTRLARQADDFDGIHVEAGEAVALSIAATHRHPEFWSRPDVFDPDRFSAERAGTIAPYSYLPFLLGRRACLGEHFAMLEGILALAMMVGRYQMERADFGPIATRPISTLRMARPLRMRVWRR
ncbi:MAG TPA: cytochrome P450 [Pseudomonadota bacterium]|nr:cytochrome P450 [Pseudomonadota bacterium]